MTRIIQISDTHLFADSKEKFHGVNTEKSFLRVLDLIQKNESHIDALMITGDLAQNGELPVYQRMMQHLACFCCPVYALPGNHDNLTHFYATFRHPKLISFHAWDLILLNSVLPGAQEGYLDEAEQTFLKDALRSDKYKLIALHHHPHPINTKLFENIDLQNKTFFWDAISRTKNTRVVVCGHVHQVFETAVGGVHFLTCPATSIQVNPKSQALSTSNSDFFTHEPPAYRWIDLHDDGRFETGTQHL